MLSRTNTTFEPSLTSWNRIHLLNLYQILYDLYTVRELQIYQSDILNLPWKRIYTTNYDDAVEFFCAQNNREVSVFTHDDDKPRKLKDGSVIHLHGSIRKIKEGGVSERLVLNEQSYVRQHFEQSLWYEEFIRDLRFCDACFFLGYSLSDYHISSLLMQNPVVRNKTHFVTHDTDPIFLNRVKPYGDILPFEIEEFAKHCRNMPISISPSNPYMLKAFQYLDPIKDRKTLAPQTANEILSLVTYGSFNHRRLSTLSSGEYVVPRQQLVDDAIRSLTSARCLLIHSRLGNGKTIFLYILANKLAEQGYRCFLCDPSPQRLQQDIELLGEFGKVVILFDSYDMAVETIGWLFDNLPEVKFIVSIRTAIQDVRFHEIQSRLPSPLERVDLNGIRPKEASDFNDLLSRSGVRVSNLERRIDECVDFRDIVTSLYDHEDIRDKIQSELKPLLEIQSVNKIFVASHLLKWTGQDIDAAFLRSVTGNDVYAEIARFPEVTRDLFKLDDEDVQVRSAVFSEYLIQDHITTMDVVECVYQIITQAVRRKKNRKFRSIMGNLMQFSNLNRALRKEPDRLEKLTSLFERLRLNNDVNEEPLFWLQYSILKTDSGDLKEAEGFIRTAYHHAQARPNFQTFQIDTYALGLFLRIEQMTKNTSRVARFDEIIAKMERVRLMIGDESRRFHAIQVLKYIDPFVAARMPSLSRSEMNVTIFNLNLLIDSLNHLPSDDRQQTGSDKIKETISRACQRILAYNAT